MVNVCNPWKVIYLLGVLSVGRNAEAANILLFNGMGEGSHFYAAAAVGTELAKNGHNVSCIISDAFDDYNKNIDYSSINFVVVKQGILKNEYLGRNKCLYETAFQGGNMMFNYSCLSTIIGHLILDCDKIFIPDFLQRLKKLNIELAIIDLSWACSAFLTEYLNVKYTVGMVPTAAFPGHLRLFGNPVNPATTPNMNSGFPQKMSFLQRVLNTLSTNYLDFLKTIFLDRPYAHIKKANGLRASYFDICYDLDLLLTSSDPIIDCPMALFPGVVNVAGLTTKPAEPLSKNLEAFMDSSGDHGVIVFSLGGYATHMPEKQIKILADAFARLDQKVIWQWKNEYDPADLSENVMTMRWLPQNDLLGHNKTRLFFSHGGNNGLYESLYHGVPILVCPLIGDQLDLAVRVTERGVGSNIDITTVTSDLLYEKITKIIKDPRYKAKAMKISAMFRDRPQNPRERAAFWIEHILKFGSDHLRPPTRDLNFIQLNLIDVYGFIALIFFVILYINYVILRALYRCIQNRCDNGKRDRLKKD